MQHGTRKRNRYDSLASINAPSWLVVRDKYCRAVEVTALEPLADLRAILTAERERRAAEGWTVEEIPTRCSFFFCARDGVRVMVTIDRRDPADDRGGVP